ncbi:Aminotransferase-like, plant mobile domain [Sesbania bispinosa]|nr:Aminotransferase-like, plant mobile domain [Sesbania bispinosa]
MTKTRGGRSDQGRESSSQSVDREDPTPDQAHLEDPAAVQVDVQADVAAPVQPDVYGGGPEDTSILRTFHRHDRGTLKVVSHGRKLTEPLDAYIRGIGDNPGLASLINCTHSLVDRGLLSAFVERWHKDTCSFHLPVGEMTITLDDVSSLLHLPVIGRLFSLLAMGKEEANMMLVSLLRVSHQYAFAKTEVTTMMYHRVYRLYEAHQVYRPFLDVSWYHGYITCGSIVLPHLPERVLRQYGHIQSIPPSPHDAFPVRGISDVHYHLLHYQEHLLEEMYRGLVMTIPGECVDDYLRWYYRISHPYLIPSVDRVADLVPHRVPRVPIVASTFDGVGDVISYRV